MDNRDIGMLSGNVTTNVTNLVVGGVIEVEDPIAEIPEIVRELVKNLIAVQKDLIEEFAEAGGSGNRSTARSNGGRSSGYSGRRGSGSRSSGSTGRRGASGGSDRKASAKQVKYALDLLDQLESDEYTEDDLADMSMQEIGKVIDGLRAELD